MKRVPEVMASPVRAAALSPAAPFSSASRSTLPLDFCGHGSACAVQGQLVSDATSVCDDNVGLALKHRVLARAGAGCEGSGGDMTDPSSVAST
jgi:hypothetical protein